MVVYEIIYFVDALLLLIKIGISIVNMVKKTPVAKYIILIPWTSLKNPNVVDIKINPNLENILPIDRTVALSFEFVILFV